MAERWESSGQGVGVWLAMARSDFRFEKNAVRKCFRIDGENKTNLVVSTPGVSFPIRFNCTCTYTWILILCRLHSDKIAVPNTKDNAKTSSFFFLTLG